MIPLNIVSKLVRRRLQITLTSRTLVTSTASLKQREEYPGKYMHCAQQGGRKGSDDCLEEGIKQQKKDLCLKDDTPKFPEESDVKKCEKRKGSSLADDDSYLKSKKQGQSKLCQPMSSLDQFAEEKNKCLEEKQSQPSRSKANLNERSSKDKRGGQNLAPNKDCNCPSYDIPKCVDEKNVKKMGKGVSGYEENISPKWTKEQDECEEQEKRDPCENRKPLRSENDSCEDKQRRKDPCEPMTSSWKNSCLQEEDECEKKKDPCSPSNKNVRVKNDECKQPHKEKNDPCKSVKPSQKSFPDGGNKCIGRTNNPTKPSFAINCPEEDECDNSNNKFRLDPCESSRKNICAEVEEDECFDMQKQSNCPEDTSKNKKCIEQCIPELPPCCKVDSAKECICKLQELQRQWEAVIAAQEGMGKENCPPGASSEAQPAPIHSKSKRSNMIYVILGAIFITVVYYTYNENFENEEFLIEELERNDDSDDNE